MIGEKGRETGVYTEGAAVGGAAEGVTMQGAVSGDMTSKTEGTLGWVGRTGRRKRTHVTDHVSVTRGEGPGVKNPG